MNHLEINIDEGSEPVSLQALEDCRNSLTKLKQTVASLENRSIVLAGISFLTGRFFPSVSHIADPMFIVGVIAFLGAYRYKEGRISRSLASVSPINSEQKKEVLAMKMVSSKVQGYCDRVEEMHREYVGAEIEAMRRVAYQGKATLS